MTEKGSIRDEAGAGMGAGDTDTDIMRGMRLGVIGIIGRGPEKDVCRTGHNQEAVRGEGMIDIQGGVQKGAIHLSIGEDAAENIIMREKDRTHLGCVVRLMALACKINCLVIEMSKRLQVCTEGLLRSTRCEFFASTMFYQKETNGLVQSSLDGHSALLPSFSALYQDSTIDKRLKLLSNIIPCSHNTATHCCLSCENLGETPIIITLIVGEANFGPISAACSTGSPLILDLEKNISRMARETIQTLLWQRRRLKCKVL